MENSILEMASEIAQIITGISVLAVSIQVYLYSRHKDREITISRHWEAQQQLNYVLAADEDALMASEYLITGEGGSEISDKVFRKAVYICFVTLNRIEPIYREMLSGMIGNEEAIETIDATLKIYIRDPKIMKYCIDRGYKKDYVKFIKMRIKRLKKEQQSVRSIGELRARINR